MANIEDTIFRAVVDYTPKVCVERALQNGDGLYHNDKFVDLEEQCLVFEDMLRELFKIAKQLNPREVQGALRRFNAVHLGKLFEEHAEGGRSARSVRVQAQGIINLIAYVNKRRRNWVDGSRARAGIGRLVRASAEAIEQPAAVRRRSKTPPSSTEKAQACGYKHDSMVRALMTEQKDLEVLQVVPVAAQNAPIEVLSSQEAVDPQDLLKPFTDWSKGALARQHADGRIKYATMFVKKDADSAFKFGRFEDGKEYESEIPALVAKRPAGKEYESEIPALVAKRPAMKRPAAAANAEIDSEPATEILPKSEDKKAPTPQRHPEVRGFTAGKYSVMFYRSGKGSFGIRPKGESTLMTINSLGSPARAASLIKDVGLPRLEAGEDPLKVKEHLYELLSQAQD